MEFSSDSAIYLQIARHLQESILEGRWVEGSRLPSVRELAVTIEVNPNTVARTYALLQEQGIIHNTRGIGYFVAHNARELTRALLRTEFISTELPRILKTMDLVGLSLEELDRMYHQMCTKGTTSEKK